MGSKNGSSITMIHLLGLQTPHSLRFFIFLIFLLMCCVTICGNLLIITLVVYSKTLHSPMYFFLSHLSLSDILLTTDILPNTLWTILEEETVMSLSGCLSQFCVFTFTESLEIILLTVMSYDRYLAICKPLHYTSIMSQQLCWVMVSMCWGVSILLILNASISLSMLEFCGPNVIDHYFCDFDPILHLSCSDTTIAKLRISLFGAFLLVISFIIIIISYIYIIITILQIPSITGKQKLFSTCSSHLSVVCLYFGTIIFVYLVPSTGQTMNINTFLSLLYTAGTPLMNPIIYSLRNRDLRQIVKNKLRSLHFMTKSNE